MSALGVVLTLSMLVAVGALLQLLVLGVRRPIDGFSTAAEGFLLGPLLVGAGLWALGDIGLTSAAWLIFGLGVASLATTAWLIWRRPVSPSAELSVKSSASDRFSIRGLNSAGRVAAVVLLLLLLTLLWQSASLPILAWDAWHAWLDKSKAWFYAGRFLPLQDLMTWWQAPAGDTRFAIAAQYPQALPRVWAALQWTTGVWRDAHLASIWTLLWLATGILFHSAIRRYVASGSAALCWVLGLLSLPMVLAHASLAGYSDLWLAAALLACMHHGAEALRGQWRHAWLAGLYLLLLPAIKLEGAVYALLLAVAFVLAAMPVRWRYSTLGVVLAALVVGVWLGGVLIPVPGLGTVGLKWGMISAPVVGELPLYWRGVGGRVLESMFLLPNWSLLWWLLPLGLWFGRRQWRAQHYQFALLALLAAAAFHFLLFCFTDAAAWAESLTSLNRLLLHVVPCWVWFVATGFNRPQAPYGRAGQSAS